MILIHLLYDLREIYGFLPPAGPLLSRLQSCGGIVFFLISGICATLSRSGTRRAFVVLGCATLVSVVSALASFPVRFGVLHALGFSMLLWQFLRRCENRPLLFAALGALSLGRIFRTFTVTSLLLYPLGLTGVGFQSADYFPLFPYLGYFLCGALLGRKFYPAPRPLLQNFPFRDPVSRLFCFCGRHSLLLYLIHQPLLLFAIESAVFLGGCFYAI